LLASQITEIPNVTFNSTEVTICWQLIDKLSSPEYLQKACFMLPKIKRVIKKIPMRKGKQNIVNKKTLKNI